MSVACTSARKSTAIAIALVALFAGCSGNASREPSPSPPEPLAKAAFAARGLQIGPQASPPSPATQFPLIAPDPPFGAPPSSDAAPGEPVPSARAPGMQL